MQKDLLTKLVAHTTGFFLMLGLPVLSRSQNPPLPSARTTAQTGQSMRPRREANPMDDFAGLNFTEDQKTQIRQIHEDMKSHRETVAKDEKLDADQKGAMLQGFERMEYRQVYDVLTPEQQTDVRKKVLARRAMERRARQKQSMAR